MTNFFSLFDLELVLALSPFIGACALISSMQNSTPARGPYTPLFTPIQNQYVGIIVIDTKPYPTSYYQLVSGYMLNASQILLIDDHGQIMVHDFVEKKVIFNSNMGLKNYIKGTAISHNGKKLAIAGNDSFFAVLDLDNYRSGPNLHNIEQYKINFYDSVCSSYSLSFSPDDKFVAINCMDPGDNKRGFIFDCEARNVLEIPFRCECLKFNPQNSNILACCDNKGNIWLLQLDQLHNPKKLKTGPNIYFNDFTFTPYGCHILAFSGKHVLDFDLNDLTGSAKLSKLHLLGKRVWPNSIKISPDGKRLLIALDSKLLIYDYQKFNCLYSFSFPPLNLYDIGHNGFSDLRIKGASFGYDGTEIVVVMDCYAVILKDLFYEKEKNNMLAYLRSQPAGLVGGYVNQKIFEYFKPIPWNGRDDGTTIECTFELPE